MDVPFWPIIGFVVFGRPSAFLGPQKDAALQARKAFLFFEGVIYISPSIPSPKSLLCSAVTCTEDILLWTSLSPSLPLIFEL